MRRLIVAALALLTAALAGCFDGSGAAVERYVALPSDLPAGFEYVDIDSEQGEFLREGDTGMTENPGYADSAIFAAFDGVEAVYVAAYADQNDSLILSLAIQFVDANATQTAAQEFAEDLCGESQEGIVYSQGAFMGTAATFGDEDPAVVQISVEAAQRVMARTGAVDVCA